MQRHRALLSSLVVASIELFAFHFLLLGQPFFAAERHHDCKLEFAHKAQLYL